MNAHDHTRQSSPYSMVSAGSGLWTVCDTRKPFGTEGWDKFVGSLEAAWRVKARLERLGSYN